MKPKFDIELLPEAVQFLDDLDEKAQIVTDNELFKN